MCHSPGDCWLGRPLLATHDFPLLLVEITTLSVRQRSMQKYFREINSQLKCAFFFQAEFPDVSSSCCSRRTCRGGNKLGKCFTSFHYRVSETPGPHRRHLLMSLMLSALPNLFFMRCANSFGFDTIESFAPRMLSTTPLQWKNFIWIRKVHRSTHTGTQMRRHQKETKGMGHFPRKNCKNCEKE